VESVIVFVDRAEQAAMAGVMHRHVNLKHIYITEQFFPF
jgi:hypothetical protein